MKAAHVRRFIRRLATFVRSRRAETELSREIASHLQLLEDRFVAKGMSREEARYAAKRAFGGVEQTKELQRDARAFRWLSGWSMDLKLGGRMLVKTPGLTAIAVVALAVAIGAGAAYMEFVNDFFRPTLAFPGGDRLVGIVNHDLAKNDIEQKSLYEFVQWKAHATTVADLGVSRQVVRNLRTDDGRVEPVRGAEVSASAFRAVPIPPLYGRPLVDDDERLAAEPVAVVGEDLWRSMFGADPSVTGRSVQFGDATYTIAGVMPASFGFPVSSNFWVPMRIDPAGIKAGEGPAIRIFGRLAEGSTAREAQAELAAIAARLDRPNAHLRPIVRPYVESQWNTPGMLWQVRILYTFNIFFIGLLAICGMNVATLVFARTATRESEITVRTALGASRGRIVAQLVAESLVFTSIAAAVGLSGASLILRTVRELWTAAQAAPMPFWWNEQLGFETIAYAGLLVAIASLVAGGVPALKATGSHMQPRLKEAGSTGASMRFGRLWTGIIVAQTAVTVVFLAAVVSLGYANHRAAREFDDVAAPRHEYLTAWVRYPETATNERWTAVLREFQRRLRDDAGIINAAYTVRLPGASPEEFWLEFAEPALNAFAHAHKKGDVLWVRSARVGTSYFETMNQRLVAGRTFTTSEVESGASVAVVDESFVRIVLGGRNPIGLAVRQPPTDVSQSPGAWFEIVGVVTDSSRSPRTTNEDVWLYRPRQLGGNAMARVIIHSRSGDVAARARAAAAATDPEITLAEMMTLARYAEVEAQTMGFFTKGLAAVSVIALMLSVAGIYALISFTLTRRTREIGIRTALGASPRRIIAGILSRSMLQVGLGIVLGGIPGAVMLYRGLEDDARMSGVVTAAVTAALALFVIGIAAISCVPPVRRALGVQPTDALRAN